jgi:hypothetical protein
MGLAPKLCWVDMKEPHVKPKGEPDDEFANETNQRSHNWNWPRKTWLRERLDMLKAREREINQKPANAEQDPPANANSADEKERKQR